MLKVFILLFTELSEEELYNDVIPEESDGEIYDDVKAVEGLQNIASYHYLLTLSCRFDFHN